MNKKHLEGGTLRSVMAQEVARQIRVFAGQDQAIDHAALALGVTPRTLRKWLEPVDKGGWAELDEFRGVGAMEKLLATANGKGYSKKKKGGKNARKKTGAAKEAQLG